MSTWHKVKASKEAFEAFNKTDNGKGVCFQCSVPFRYHSHGDGNDHNYIDAHYLTLELLKEDVEKQRKLYNENRRESRKQKKISDKEEIARLTNKIEKTIFDIDKLQRELKEDFFNLSELLRK